MGGRQALNRRSCLSVSAAGLAAGCLFRRHTMAAEAGSAPEIIWHDVTEWGVQDRTYTNAAFRKAARERHAGSRAALRAALRAAHARLVAEGVPTLYYLDGDLLLGNDGKAATDGWHPNDLGMVRSADAYEKALREIFSRPA